MSSEEIKNKDGATPDWLKEIAYQLAISNEARLASEQPKRSDEENAKVEKRHGAIVKAAAEVRLLFNMLADEYASEEFVRFNQISSIRASFNYALNQAVEGRM